MPTPPALSFGRIAATLAVSDVQRALSFYVEVLGMTPTFTNGDPVGFVILQRGAAELHLTLTKRH